MKIVSTLLLTFFATFAFAKQEEIVKQQAMRSLANTPITFTRNDGQIDTHGKADCRFTTNVGGGNYFFCADGIVADYRETVSNDEALTQAIKGHVLKLNFANRTNFRAEVTGEDEQEYKCNYFFGSDPSKWHTNVPNYLRIVYKNVWQGIDVVYHSANVVRAVSLYTASQTARATLEYDVIVHPGANPNQIQFSYEGQDALSIDSKGNLVIKTSLGDVIEQHPFVYQIVDGEKKEIASRFVLSPNDPSVLTVHSSQFTFALGDYDKTKNLVIDPAYSTYLSGNSGSSSYGIAVDTAGNAFVTGIAGSDFPTTPGAYKTTSSGSFYVTKINATGSALIYSTFLGGVNPGYVYSYGGGIAIDKYGNVFITGSTSSTDFPPRNAFQGTCGGSGDAFVTKLNATGNDLIYSTFLGGNGQDGGHGIAVDSLGNAYVTGYTESKNFPITPAPGIAYQPILKGSTSAFVTKFKPNGEAIDYSTYLGGSVGPSGTTSYVSLTLGYGLAIDHDGNAYITGTTNCYDFPTTKGALQTSDSIVVLGGLGYSVIFVTKFTQRGDGLAYSTYLTGKPPSGGGTDIYEQPGGISVDDYGNIFITGKTSTSNFPTTPNAFKTTGRGFMTKLKPAGQGNQDLLYSTYLGIFGRGIAVDAGGNVLITGESFSVMKLKPAGQGNQDLLYSTYLGGGSVGLGIVVDTAGSVFITGSARAGFPTTSGAYQKTYAGTGGHAFITKFNLMPMINMTDLLNFDSVNCSEGQTNLLIENLSADVPLKIDTMTFSGPNAANFSFVTPPKFPITISASGDTQLVLQLTRSGIAGLKTGFLNIHSNDDAPLADTLKKVTLIGVIDSIGVVTLKKNITFGQLRCEEVSFDTVVQVKNKGLQPATIIPTVSGDGATSFTIAPSSSIAAAGATTNFTIHFQPSGNGSFSAHIKFSDNACDLTFDTTYVTGSKVSDVSLTSSPTLIDFGEHCHSTTVDSFITVHNTSNATVTLDPAAMNGNGFTVLSPTTSVTLLPDSSVRYKIRFTSSGIGNYQGSISIMGKPCNISVSNQLRGSEIEPPKITVSPTTVFFDTLDCSEPERFTKVKVRNVGTRTITLKPVITGDTGSYHAQPELITILKNSSFNVTITFHPDSIGEHAAYLFFNDELCGLLKDWVSVRGFKSSIGAITGTPVPLKFDTMDCSAGGPDTMSLWIKNTGGQILNLNKPTVSGNGFTIENANGILGLAPSDSIEYGIIFTPNGEGTYLDTFRITGTCGVLFTCPLSGVCDYTIDVAEQGRGNVGEFFLGQNHPNPFSHSCQLSVVSRQSVKFEIRDMLGRIVYQRSVASATTQLTFDAGDLPNGVYLYTITDGVNIRSRMMTVMK